MFKTLNLSMCMHVPDPFDEDFLKVLWGSEIVDGAFVFFEIERILKESGRTPWDLKNMIKLMFLNSMDKEESSREISKSAKNNNWYRMFCGEIGPSSRSIRDYRKIYNAIYQLILSFVLIVTHKLDLSDFYHVSVDGTIMLACNSPFNTICKKDVHLLLKHYMVEELSKKEIKKLRKRARKFLIKNKLSYDDTIELLYDWYDKLELTGQKSISLWDVDARWMKIKDKGQKYKKLTYNVQFCTDTKTKMICAINPVQYPTDHYQIPAIVDQAFRNLPIKPRMLSADTIYGTLSNFYYLKQHGISARIPTREQCKTLNEESDDNPFAKKKFDFDEKKNVYVCPQKHELTPDGVYDAPPEKGGFHKKQIVYSNYFACQKCPCKSQCTSAKHRTITRYVHELSYEIEKIMDTPEGQKDYEQRSRTVEAHNGTFKRIYKFNELQITGLDNMRGYLFKTAASYNTIRLFNIIVGKGWDIFEVILSIRVIASNKEY